MQDIPLNGTPDFYVYEGSPVSSVDLAGELVIIRWPDGAELRAHALWLWENRMNGAIDGPTRECTIDPAELPAANVLASAQPTGEGHLEVCWHGAAPSVHHSGWLRHVAEGRHRTDAGIPVSEPWTVAQLPAPPTFDGPAVLAGDDETLHEWLSALCRHGLARLEGLPTSDDVLPAIARRIGALRETNFGVTWPVTVDVDPTSTANTPLPLPPHTDLPTRETPPGFQLLHCLANTCEAGFSTMTDGLAVIERLLATDPVALDALTSLNWVFFNRSRDHDHRWSGPIVDSDGPGRPLTLRAFHPVRAFPDMDPEDVPRAYEALRTFGRIAESADLRLSYPFRPGDLVGFDNRRILHGREGIDVADGTRSLHGCYLDHDEVYSRLRVLSRRRAEQAQQPHTSTTEQREI